MKKSRIFDIITGCLVALSLLFALMAGVGTYPSERLATMARRTGRHLDARMKVLERYAGQALRQDRGEWLDLPGLPRYVVIYRYEDDTLQSWCNRFPIFNDAIAPGMFRDMMVNPRSGARTPLADVGPETGFFSFGPKWYLARLFEADGVKVIAGLELRNYDENYSLRPLSSSEGQEVLVNGVPVFKIAIDTPGAGPGVNSRLLFSGLALLLLAGFIFLLSGPTLARFWIAVVPILPIMAVLMLWGRRFGADIPVFSSAVYADNDLFYSLWAHVNIVVAIVLGVSFLFIVRRNIYRRLRSSRAIAAWSAGIVAAAAATLFYSVLALRSITLNSNISLELYKLENFSVVSAVVYFAYILLVVCVMMLVQMLQPAAMRFLGRRIDAFELKSRIAVAILAAVLFVGVTALAGLRKEQATLEVSAGRLAVSRDISLEMYLRSVEDRIASDPIIASLSVLENSGSSISGRLEESYFARTMQDYDVTVSQAAADMAVLERAEAIAPGSRFAYVDADGGYVDYVGAFTYNISGYGLSRVLVTIRQKGDRKYKGYASIAGISLPGEVLIPAKYSFARYEAGRLLSFKGNYAYSERISPSWKTTSGRFSDEGWVHFVYPLSEDDFIVISRQGIRLMNYVIAVIFIGLLCFLSLSLFSLRKTRRKTFGQSWFQTRIRLVVMVSLVLTLVTMAAVSLAFVVNRNEVNRNTMMSDKINLVQSSLAAGMRSGGSLSRLIDDVSHHTNTDITLYSPSGTVMMSTAPELFYQLQIDPRIDGRAYREIVLETRRYYIQKERLGDRTFYSMYAPLNGDDGTLRAIICSPYTDESYDFESYVVSHALMIASLFIFLLLAALFMVGRVLELMFKPLVEMGTKMDAAGIGDLEYIRYENKDEISGLVNAYNRMVSELSESTRKLAQAERDKAWSGMARQVAHEIKNPLTPMKLQIQRLIRLKNKGGDAWQEKFDEISRILLDHIEMLSDTANEFSTFAKLYSQEPDEIDLSALLQEEISIFEGRDDIRFEFIGLPDVKVMGPKPQLTRVFVNLIGNSVQALGDTAAGERTVRVSLRNSINEGFWDIVFEDSGPGVAEENVDKLFTPNFTTKNGGSGLGLAISRSVLERCGASISYSRSFALGGACFTILYPKG